MKTKIIGTRIPVVLYEQLEKCTGDSRTLGEVLKEILERYCFPSDSKSVVNRSNTSNPGTISDKVYPNQLLDNLFRPHKPSDRSDNFEV